MMSEVYEAYKYIRRGAWHLRTGGLQQLKKFRTRQNIVQGTDARPALNKQSPLRRVFRRHAPTITLDFPELEASPKRSLFDDIHVATILDDFSEAAWGHEFTTYPLTPASWEQTLRANPIDLLLVESAWSGSNGTWRYKLTGSNAPAPELTALTRYCKAQGIPTVFWNKEDPPHFEDFLETAKLFDVVFTSDANKIPDYCRVLGHNRVQALSFAAQEAIHNPIRPNHGYHERDIAFAGMYFAHKYPERRQQMDLLLGAAYSASEKMQTGLEIFSRFLGDDPNYQFPAPYSTRVVGSLSYRKMLTAYKAYKVFLNVNSVTDSPSMCARRVFEITASGTPVVTTRSEAIPHFFGLDEVPVVDTREEARHSITALVRSPELNNRTVHLAQRKIWEHHTYSHRAAQVLSMVGKQGSERLKPPSVSALVSTNRPQQIDHIFETLQGFTNVELELNLLTHGFELPHHELHARARDSGISLNILTADSTQPLGACLNQLVHVSGGDVLTKIDDDDLYGQNYLRDLLHALRFSGADIVGKQAHYMHLAQNNATILRNPEREHRWTTFVAGPTITGKREIFVDTPFAPKNRGEDTTFLNTVASSGGRIYSADRYNFTQMRSHNVQGHTWDIGAPELLATGELKFYGLGTEHIMF